MSRSYDTVRKALLREIPSEARLLLAVSGGRDSMALLSGCASIARQKRLHLEVAHLDHRLRPESGPEAEFVRRTCERMGVPFHLHVLGSPPPRQNIEGWARRERYNFFSKVRRERELSMTITAHHADDSAETLLMRLLSNKEPRTIRRWDARRKVLRPLLTVSRAAIDRYIKDEQLEFVDDSSNAEVKLFRNRVRHLLIPTLREHFSAGIVETLAQRAEFLSEDIGLLDSAALQIVRKDLAGFVWGNRGSTRELRSVVTKHPRPLRWRILAVLLQDSGVHLGRAYCSSAVQVALGKARAVNLPGGVRVGRRRGALFLDIFPPL